MFTSIYFVVFVAALLCIYYICPKKMSYIILLIASVMIYIRVEKKYIICMAVTLCITYACTLINSYRISRCRVYISEGNYDKKTKKEIKKRYKKINSFVLGFNLFTIFAMLALFKYSDISHISIISGRDLIVPMGMSFYTFMAAGYAIDVYRQKYEAEKNILKVALFISYFPQILQGPINRFDKMKETLFIRQDFKKDIVVYGLIRVLYGYMKKLVIADRLIVAVNIIVDGRYSGIYVLIMMILYAVVIYADFTGGIDIAMGISEMFSIKMMENFNCPYFSRSVAEYWRRWHISLGEWFKEYLYYPVSVSRVVTRCSDYFRNRGHKKISMYLPVYIASIIVWFATGVWHGNTANYIVWGLLNCMIILISASLRDVYAHFYTRTGIRQNAVFQMIRTFMIMSMLRCLDCYKDTLLTIEMLISICTDTFTDFKLNNGFLLLNLSVREYILVLLLLLIITYISTLKERKYDVRKMIIEGSFVKKYTLIFLLILVICIFGVYGIGYVKSDFIYNQF